MALREFDFEKEPTVSIVKKILTDAIKMKATDIHFDPTSDELVIKFRINGELNEYTTAPDNVKTNIITRIKILAGMNITDSLLPQIGAINFELDSKSHNMRVSSLPIIDGEKIVVHISNYAKYIKSISKMGFDNKDVKTIKEMLKEPQGIILITGTTNSGKTTTIYSLLKELNSKSNNIISIEDPIKMKIKGVNQVQISNEKGLTYRNLLKSVLLQDPNIISINELVDDETARMALRASLSGRLVISTMHTKTVYQTIDTLLNMDVENYLLGSNLVGIISQRLVKKLCPTCREKRKVSKYEAKIIKNILGEDVEELYYPKGCEECKNGYIDQIPIAEVIKINDELRNAISNNKRRDLIRNIIYEENNTIIKDGLQKAINGDTSFEEIIRILDLKIDFTENDEKIKNIIFGNEKVDEEEIIPEKEENKNVENNNQDDDEIISTKIFELNEDEDDEKENKIITEKEKGKITEAISEIKKNEEEILNNLQNKTEENKINFKESEVEKEAIEKDKEIVEKTEVKDNSSNEIKQPENNINTVEEKTEKNTHQLMNFDDDDDDDDFNYDSSYINNF